MHRAARSRRRSRSDPADAGSSEAACRERRAGGRRGRLPSRSTVTRRRCLPQNRPKSPLNWDSARDMHSATVPSPTRCFRPYFIRQPHRQAAVTRPRRARARSQPGANALSLVAQGNGLAALHSCKAGASARPRNIAESPMCRSATRGVMSRKIEPLGPTGWPADPTVL